MIEGKETIQSKGGKARSEKLNSEQRKEIATRAAEARWGVLQATHTGSIPIGDISIQCAVLADGTRILTQEGFLRAIGRSGKPAKGRGSQVEKMAPFLDLDNLKPFVDIELADSTKPMVFKVPSGGRAYGYRAELLPRVCDVYLKARENGALLKSQEKMAHACEVLMRALAHIGIVALVDEATGFQDERDRNALAKILEEFITKELRKWVKTFPPAFYKEMFRLRDIPYDANHVKKPKYIGHLTNNVVYDRLAPGVRKELKRVTPRDKKGRHKQQLHRRLTEDTGHPKLREHLASVVGIMKGYDDWDSFIEHLDRAHPKWDDTLLLPFGKTTGEPDKH